MECNPPPPNQESPLTNKEVALLHWTFHPNDIPKQQIRQLYNFHCKEVLEGDLGIKKFIVAVHGAPNIRSAVTRAKLIQEHGNEASKYFEGEPIHI
mmetsp:Transcript_27748/g.55618  ORF Transcript_27748/g.55618 Transcript_27748/m.55618 type:complete len:96 (-) Transcript_27748:202-489(-)